MKVGGAAAIKFDRWHEERRLLQRQQPLEKEDLLGRRFAQPDGRQSIILEMPAGADQQERGINLQIRNRSLVIGQLSQPLGKACGQAFHDSARGTDRKVFEGILHAFAGSRAAWLHPPAVLSQPRQIGVTDRPLLVEVALVQQQHERQRTVIGFDTLAQRKRDIEGRRARPVGDQHISGRAAHIGHAERVDIVLTREIPKNEVHDSIWRDPRSSCRSSLRRW